MCGHSPLTPELCKPSKAVRTTAKAYLKTAEKKLADERAKAQAGCLADTPPAAAPINTEPSLVPNGNGQEESRTVQLETENEAAVGQPRLSVAVGGYSSLTALRKLILI